MRGINGPKEHERRPDSCKMFSVSSLSMAHGRLLTYWRAEAGEQRAEIRGRAESVFNKRTQGWKFVQQGRGKRWMTERNKPGERAFKEGEGWKSENAIWKEFWTKGGNGTVENT